MRKGEVCKFKSEYPLRKENTERKEHQRNCPKKKKKKEEENNIDEKINHSKLSISKYFQDFPLSRTPEDAI